MPFINGKWVDELEYQSQTDEAMKLGKDFGGNKFNANINPMDAYLDKEGLFGITNQNWNNLGQAAGLAGTAYGLYDSLLGNKAKLFKEQTGMLKEQRAANQESLANKRKFNETWANASNGLAASYGAPRVG